MATSPPAPGAIIDPLSVVPLYIEMFVDEDILSCGTAFTVRNAENRDFLITNWHNFSGRNRETGEPLSKKSGRTPNRIAVWHHGVEKLGAWRQTLYTLYDAGKHLWRESGVLDVAALELPPGDYKQRLKLYPLDLGLADSDIALEPSEPVSIVGFPFGKKSSVLFPIWKTGHIASDLDLNCDDKPMFLVDVTGRSGMSGSPVIAKRIGMCRRKSGTNDLSIGSATRFLGVYSGSLVEGSEIGMVWKPECVRAVLP